MHCSELRHFCTAYGSDVCLGGSFGVAAALYWGAHDTARKDWRKAIGGFEHLQRNVARGSVQWSTYQRETARALFTVSVMHAFGDFELCATLYAALPWPVFASDADARENFVSGWFASFFHQFDDGTHHFFKRETFSWAVQALPLMYGRADGGAAVAVEEVTPHLQPEAALIDVLTKEVGHHPCHGFMAPNLPHPTVLGARLYAMAGQWEAAERVVNAAVELWSTKELWQLSPLFYVEALRLAARCRGHASDAQGACRHLERAVEVVRTCRYVSLELVVLGELWKQQAALADGAAAQAATRTQLAEGISRCRARPEELTPLLGDGLDAVEVARGSTM